MEARAVSSPPAPSESRASKFRLDLGRRRRTVVGGLILGGLAMVSAGGLVESEHGYVGALLLEIGAALFLAVPLILLERLMENRIKDEVQIATEQLQTRIDELGTDTRSRIAAARESDADLLGSLSTDASEKNVWRALHRVQEFSALDQAGVRIRIPDSSLRMRFKADPPGAGAAGIVSISIEERDGAPVTEFETWTPDEAASAALAQLAASLQRHGQYPGDQRFDATAIFKSLARTLSTVLRVRTEGRRGGPLGALVELDGLWAITVDGLEHVDDATRAIPREELVEAPEHALATLSADASRGDAQTIAGVVETAVQYHSGVARRAADERLVRDA